MNIATYFSLILSSILSVQALLPTLKGASKKVIVLSVLQVGSGVLAALPDAHLAEAGALIDATVKTLQAVGVFGKDQIPVTAAVPA